MKYSDNKSKNEQYFYRADCLFRRLFCDMISCFSLKLINIEHNKMLLLTTEGKNHRKIVKYVIYIKKNLCKKTKITEK